MITVLIYAVALYFCSLGLYMSTFYLETKYKNT